MPNSPAEVFRALAEALGRIGLGWYVFGAQAVMVWGRPRFTEDIDITVACTPASSPLLVSALEACGFGLRVPDVGDFVVSTWVLPLEHLETGIPVDVVLGASGLEEQFLARARRVRLGDVDVPFISPEDLVVAKILAGRTKDLEDAQGILQLQADRLDIGQVRTLLGLLEEALDPSDLLMSLDRILNAARKRGPRPTKSRQER